MTSDPGKRREPLSAAYRWTSLFEVALGVFLVLGHNVFKVVPNEVFFLFALFWVSFKVRDGGWKVAGLARPASRRSLIRLPQLIGRCLAALLDALQYLSAADASLTP
jgi:hypothetical protein